MDFGYYNMDCMDGMKEFPDGYFDLAIVDVGSASSLIACYRTNHPYVGFELDKHYYELSKKRLDAEMAQMRLSDFMPEVMP